MKPCNSDSKCLPLIKNPDSNETSTVTDDYDFQKCGHVEKSIQLRISTGIRNKLRPAEYPWLVRIEIYSTRINICAGTLIHPQWVLTAAHCFVDRDTNSFYPASSVYVSLGHYHRFEPEENQLIVQPTFYLIHPKFSIGYRLPVPIHDIALIKLDRYVSMSSWISTACLPEPTDILISGALAYAAGWGLTSQNSSASDEPRKAKLRISPDRCQDLYFNKYFHICTWSRRGQNICGGDSGTGLMVYAGTRSDINQTDWRWFVFGVASYGLSMCSTRFNHENVFALVSTDLDWIHQMMRTDFQ